MKVRVWLVTIMLVVILQGCQSELFWQLRGYDGYLVEVDSPFKIKRKYEGYSLIEIKLEHEKSEGTKEHHIGHGYIEECYIIEIEDQENPSEVRYESMSCVTTVALHTEIANVKDVFFIMVNEEVFELTELSNSLSKQVAEGLFEGIYDFEVIETSIYS